MNLNVIKRLTIEAKTQGVDPASASLNRLKTSYEGVAKSAEVTATATETAAKRQLSAASAVERLQRQYDQQYRQQQDLTRVQTQLDRARMQGIVTLDQQNRIMGLAQQRIMGVSAANDNLRQTGMAAQDVLSRLGINLPIIGAAGPIAAVGAAVAVLAAGATKAVGAFEKFEAQTFVLEAVIRATGQASGKTVKDVEALAAAIGDISNVREAAAQLMTFRSIAGDTFTRTLKLADDLAAVGFGNIQSAAMQLGRALEDPERGFSTLRRAGIVFSESQQQVIKDLHETGRVAEAQRMMLDALEKKVGGAGAAKDQGLTGAYEALSDAVQRFMEQWGASIAGGAKLAEAIRSIAAAIDYLNERKIAPDLLQLLQFLSGPAGWIGAAGSMVGRRLSEEFNEQGKAAEGLRQGLEKLAEARRKEIAQENATRAAAEARADRVNSAIDSINRETDALRKSDIEKAREAALRKAGISATDKEAASVIKAADAKFKEEKAIEARNTAEKEAEALGKRNAEGMRRFNEQLDSRMQKLDAERRGIGLSTEAALALKTAEEDLARLRERGIPVSAELEAHIRQRAAEYAKERTEVEALKEAYEAAQDAAKGFGQSLLSGLLQGRGLMESLTSAAQRLISTLASKTLDRVMSGGSLFGGQNLMSASGGLTMAASGLAGYQSGYTAQDPVVGGLTGALGGAMAGATFGPIGMAVGAVVGGAAGIFGALQGASDAAEEAAAQARAAWRALREEVAQFHATAIGRRGELLDDLTQLKNQWRELRKAVPEGGHGGHAMDRLDRDYEMIRRRMIENFRSMFVVIRDSLEEGFGVDGPAVQAAAAVQDLSAQLLRLREDAKVAGSQVGGLRRESQEALLRLLEGPEELSAVQTRLQELSGTSRALHNALEQLGISAKDATRAIKEGLESAMADLRRDFNRGISERLRAATGRGYINEIRNMLEEFEQLRKDAEAVGGNQSQVTKLFNAEAEDLLHGANITAVALRKVAERFPELSAAVTEVLGDMAKAQREDLNARINALTGRGHINDLTALVKEREELLKQGLVSEQLIDRFFRASVQAVVDGADLSGDAFNELIELFPNLADVITQAAEATDGFQQSIRQYLDQLQIGDHSTLSPVDRLAEAQRIFNEQYTLAAAGDSAARSNITQYADALLNSARDVWSSSRVYQQIFQSVQEQLRGLIPGMAGGGWVTGPNYGVDSELRMMAPGEFVVPAPAARAHAPMLEAMRGGSGSNDMVSEIRALRAEVAALRKEQSGGLAQVAQASIDGASTVAVTVGDAMRQTAIEARQAKNDPRARAA